jgi:hypothetical protein
MHEMVSVHIPNRPDQVIEDALGSGFIEVFIGNYVLEKLTARTQLRSNVDKVIVFEIFVHLHYVWMVLSRERLTSCRKMLNSFMINCNNFGLFLRSICLMALMFPISLHSYLCAYVLPCKPG